MKLSFLTLVTALTLISFPAFAAGETVHIKILGMVCDFCAQSIEKVFMKTGQVESLDISLKDSLIILNMKDGQTLADEAITKHIVDSGYTVESIHHQPEVKHD